MGSSPDANEFTVNTKGSNSQYNPDITTLTDGNFVIVWHSYDPTTDGSGAGVSAQIFSSAGPVGGEILVNAEVTGNQGSAYVTALNGGGFVVTWSTHDPDTDSDDRGVAARIFNADGTPASGEFRLSAPSIVGGTGTTGIQKEPEVSALNDGGFVATWITDDTTIDGSGSAIVAQRYSSTGIAQSSSEFVVNTSFTDEQAAPTVAGLPSGGFVITWQTESSPDDNDTWGVSARIFDSSGTAVGNEFTVSTENDGQQAQPNVAALDGGGFVITWHSYDPQVDANAPGIAGQKFDNAGNKIGNEFIVHTNTANAQSEASISALTGGGFVITWTNFQSGSSTSGDIAGQLFNSEGNKVGGEFVVNSGTVNHQYLSAVTTLANNKFAVTYSSNDPSTLGSDFDIVARTFSTDAAALNVAPTNSANTVTGTEDTAYTFQTSDFNFSDSDHGSALASVRIDTTTTGLALDGTPVVNEQVISAADITAGDLTYTPTAHQSGNGIAGFGFTVNDGHAFAGSHAVMTIDINPVNDAPVFTGAGTLTAIDEDTADPAGATVTSLMGTQYNDVENETFTGIVVTSNAANSTTEGVWQFSSDGGTTWLSIGTASTAAGVMISSDSLLRFASAANFNGTPSPLTVFAVDNSAASTFSSSATGTRQTFDTTADDATSKVSAAGVPLTTSINSVDDAPTAADNTEDLAINTPYTIQTSDLSYSDVDGDTLVSITIDSLTLGADDTLRVNGVDVNVNDIIPLVRIDGGDVEYTPATDQFGDARTVFTYTVNNANGSAASASTFTFNVAQGNQAPTSSNSTVSATEDTSYTFKTSDFNFNDPDTGDTLGVVVINNINLAAGDQLLYQNNTAEDGEAVSFAELANGDLVYIPAANANGNARATFDFTVRDNHNEPAVAASTLTINVADVPEANTGGSGGNSGGNSGGSSGSSSGGSNSGSNTPPVTSGTSSTDTLEGSSADDVIDGGGGADTLNGGDGDDSVVGGDGDDQVFAGASDTGDDTIQGNRGDDILGGGEGDDLIVGGDVGTNLDTTTTTDAGDDTLFGGAGNDLIIGGSFDTGTNTVIPTDQGDNTVWAGSGDDTVHGDKNNDILGGGAGNDLINAGEGNDVLYGGKGDGDNSDTLNGGDGGDRVFASLGEDDVDGGSGDDTLFGGAGNDTVVGGNGDDQIWGGTGDDSLTGGEGSDTFSFIAGFGTDTIVDIEEADFLDLSGIEGLTLSGLMEGATAVGGDTLLKLTEQDSILLSGFSLEELQTLIDADHVLVG